jgi:hypothetical protein
VKEEVTVMTQSICMPDQSRDQRPALPRGRLMFALDATASRARTWAIARDQQAKMFRAAAPIGQLDVQLVAYYGDKFGHTKWVSSGEQLAQSMNKIECVGGVTQIHKVLEHALRETEKAAVQGLIFIGDAIETDQSLIKGKDKIEELAAMAGQLGALGTPIFTFQEGRDPAARKAFRLLALRSGGAYFEFNPDNARAVEQLSDQLNAIARLAVGDAEALSNLSDGVKLLQQRHGDAK